MLEDRARTAHVEAHETAAGRVSIVERGVRVARRVEHLAVVEREACVVDEEVLQPVVVHVQTTAVQPHQERSLGTDGADGRYVLLQEPLHITDVGNYSGVNFSSLVCH